MGCGCGCGVGVGYGCGWVLGVGFGCGCWVCVGVLGVCVGCVCRCGMWVLGVGVGVATQLHTSSGFRFSLTNPVMGGFQGTSVTALPSVSDEGWNSQKRPYSTLAKQ